MTTMGGAGRTGQGPNYVLVSADGHCGADLLDYKPYLERSYHEAFDLWAEGFQDPWASLDTELDDFGSTPGGDHHAGYCAGH